MKRQRNLIFSAVILTITVAIFAPNVAAESDKVVAAKNTEPPKQVKLQQESEPNAVAPYQALSNDPALAKIAEALGDMPAGEIEQHQIIRASDAMINELNAQY